MTQDDLDAGTDKQLPIVQKSNLLPDKQLFADFRQALIDKVEGEWIPNADHTNASLLAEGKVDKSIEVDDDDVELKGQATLDLQGPKGEDQITVVTGKLEVKENATLRGKGTLIVQGDLEIEDNATFEWDGTVIVLGGKGGGEDAEAEIEDNSIVNITGAILVLSNRGQEAEFEINGSATVNITGIVASISDPAIAEEAEFEIDGGTVRIDGILLTMGTDEAELELDNDKDGTENTGTLTINGAVFVGVTRDASAGGGAVEVELEDKLSIYFDPDVYTSALDTLKSLIEDTVPQEKLPPAGLKIARVYRNAKPE